jgi:phosphoglycerate dehydrogenase-like enzyme
MKTLLTWHASPAELDIIRSCLPASVELAMTPSRPYLGSNEADPQDIISLANGADAMMGWASIPRPALDAAPNLRFIAWLHAGCEQLDFPTLRSRQILVSNVGDAHCVTIAEHAFALVLALAKRVIQNHRITVEVQRQPWWEPESACIDLAGKTMAVVGLGRIGEAIAKRAKAFDMRVLGVKRDPTKHEGHADEVFSSAQLQSVLSQADFVVVAVPLTADNRNLIGEDELRAMRKSAYLVNIGRGPTIHEGALARALTEGWIAGFAADVWWNTGSPHYPTPSKFEIHRMPNVVCSCDQAGNVMGVKERMFRLGADSLGAFARGDVPPRLIDLELGY